MLRAILTILIVSFSVSSFANPAHHKVLVRVKNSDDQKIVMKRLPDLISENSFEGKHFKVVLGKSNEAIKFIEKDRKLLLKAATVYYHASVAREFFVKTVKSKYVAGLPQIVLRLEITNKFNEMGHYANDNNEPQFNNALTVPAGKTPSFVPVKDEWNHEIWFRPKKVLKTADMELNLGENPLEQNLRIANDVAQDFVTNSAQFDILTAIFKPEYQSAPLWESLIRSAGTFAVFKGIYEGSKKMDKLFLNTYFYLDTALIPEIIYHEFAHVALSDALETTVSTPVLEGMADFFATLIEPQKEMMAPIDGISNNSAKNPYNKKGYSPAMEDIAESQSDFVLSVLWKLHENMKGGAMDLIYESRKHMSTDETSIRNGLPRSILKSCRARVGQVSVCRRQVLETIKSKGF